MNLGKFRRLTSHLPDEALLLVDEGDLRFAELSPKFILSATGPQDPAILLEMGQVWNYELDLDNRIDSYLARGY